MICSVVELKMLVMCMQMYLCTYDYQKDGALDTNLIYIYLIWFVVYMHVFRRTRS